jgi:hypothetical protein
MDETKTAVVAKINNIDIVIIENGDDIVPIKPICEALHIDYSTQVQRLKSDPILSSTLGLNPIVAADGKDREMLTIPLKYIFGWLFRIDSRNVKEEARETILKYQIMCYDALFDHFVGAKKFLKLKETETARLVSELKKANKNYFTAKTLKHDAESNLEKLATQSYEEYITNNCQLAIQFPEEIPLVENEEV